MKTRATVIPLLLGLGCGLGLAVWLNPPRPAAADHAESAGPALTMPIDPALSAPVLDPAPDSEAPAEATPPIGNAQPVWQSLTRVAPPSGKAGEWLRIPVLRAKGPPAPPSPLNPEFAEFFGLNDGEKARIEAELHAVITEQADLDFNAAHAIPITEGNGFLSNYEFALVIDPYPEKGAALYDRLNTLLRDTLGAERMAVYNRWSQASLLADWQGLGLSERTLHIKRQNPGRYQIWDVNYEAKAPDGTRQQFNSAGNQFDELEQRANFPVGRWLKIHPLADAPAAKTP